MQLGIFATIGLLVGPRVFRSWSSKSLEAELLAEEELAKRGAEKAGYRRSAALARQSNSATKERKIQRNRSRKERRRLVDGLESKDAHIDLDDDSGSTQSSQSDSGGGCSIQPLEQESSWTPATSKQAKKALRHEEPTRQKRQEVASRGERAEKPTHQKKQEGASRGEREVKPTRQKRQEAISRGEGKGTKLKQSSARTAPRMRNSETSKQSNKNDPKPTLQAAKRAVRTPAKELDRPHSNGRQVGGRGSGATVQLGQPDTRPVSKQSGRPSRDRPPRKVQAANSQRTNITKAAVPVVNAWKKSILAAPEVAEVCMLLRCATQTFGLLCFGNPF